MVTAARNDFHIFKVNKTVYERKLKNTQTKRLKLAYGTSKYLKT